MCHSHLATSLGENNTDPSCRGNAGRAGYLVSGQKASAEGLQLHSFVHFLLLEFYIRFWWMPKPGGGRDGKLACPQPGPAQPGSQVSACGWLLLSLCHLAISGFLGICVGNGSCVGTDLEVAADLGSHLLAFFTAVLSMLSLASRNPCGMVVWNPEACSVLGVYLALLHPACQPPATLLPAREGWKAVVHAHRLLQAGSWGPAGIDGGGGWALLALSLGSSADRSPIL